MVLGTRVAVSGSSVVSGSRGTGERVKTEGW